MNRDLRERRIDSILQAIDDLLMDCETGEERLDVLTILRHSIKRKLERRL